MMDLDEYLNDILDRYERGEYSETQLNYLIESQGIDPEYVQKIYHNRQTWTAIKWIIIAAFILFVVQHLTHIIH